MHKVWAPLLVAAVVAVCAGGGARAQRAGDNAVTAAQDAFGTTVGNETIGLYTSSSARGFNPVQAGNIRLEGLYFFQPSAPVSLTGLDSHLSKGSTVRVGLTAQSYPFPAPTGIADFELRLPGDKPLTSVVINYGPYETYKADVDTQIPLVPGKLGMLVGVGGGLETSAWGGDNTNWSAATLFRWRPSDRLELIPFASHIEKYDWETAPQVSTGGPWLPPKIKRRAHYLQDWSRWDTRDTNLGVLGRLLLGPSWVLRTGLFYSYNARPHKTDHYLRNVQQDGLGDAYVIRDPAQSNGAYSGEMRLSGAYAEGPRRHTVHVAVRGHTARRSYGGGRAYLLGPRYIYDYHAFPEPDFVFDPQGHDKTRQGTVAVGYGGRWADVGEVSAGVQKTFYRRTFDQPGVPLATSRSRPWLYNGTLALFATRDLTLYGGYTRGLEDSASAPESAANRGQALPANITQQVDAGIRYALTPRLRLVAGVFEVKKPYLDRDAANIYTNVGAIKHRGIELSLSGQVVEGLTVVAGAVLLRARVSGFAVDQGLISPLPAGATPRLLRLNLQYGPPQWHGFSVDGQVENKSRQAANRLNTLKTPSSVVFNLGGRYQFPLFSNPASFRVQVLNLGNRYLYSVNASGIYAPSDSARRYTARFSVDF